jgi:ParB family chromosome partitioning protein
MSRGVDRLKASLGGNIADSIRRDRGGPGAPPGHDGGRQGPPTDRYAGLDRVRAYAIPVDRIEPDPGQPRREFGGEELGRLAASLKARGQLQPVRVRWDEGRGVYVILAGERRWRAAKLAGLEALSCVVQEGDLTEDERLMVQLVENALREDLKPVEQARAFRRLMDARGYSTRDLADELHVAQSSVVRALSLLGLPAEVQDRVDGGSLPATTASELARIAEPDLQAEAARAAVEQGMNRAEVTDLVRALRSRRSAPAPAPAPDPVSVEVDGCVVTLRWRRANGLSPLQVLRRACREVRADGS